jgi:hypothetical protein
MTIQLEKLVSKLELDNKGFKAGLVSAAAGVTALVAGMTVAIKATFDWAEDLDSLGDVMDGSKIKLAALAFVARKSGVGVDTLAKANVLLEKGLLKSNGQLDVTGKKLKEYGINVKDANGHVKDSVQLTDEISKKYAELSTQTERVNFLTEIYGKNGAALVDFYDTLAKEGGIDAVTKKVKAFGLAIDPDRYEQFNRNLEELKLIGLGLAVQFTEKVMPVLERFLGWLNKTAQSSSFNDVKKKISRLLDDILGGGDKGVTLFDHHNKDKVAQPDFWNGVGTTIGNAIETGVTAVINPAFWEKITTPPPGTGDKFASFMEGLTGISRDVKPGSAQDPIANMVRGWGNSLDTWFKETQTKIDAWSANTSTKFSTWAATTVSKISTWAATTKTSIDTWASGTLTAVQTWASTLAITLDNKLREIAKTFFTRALGWTQQMIEGFKSGLGGLLSAIGGMVDDINDALKKITFPSLPSWITALLGGGGSASTSNLPGAGKPGNPIVVPKGSHATGGAVMAGQLYSVNEIGKPEYFLPHTAGRISPTPSNQNVTARIAKEDMRELARYVVEYGLKAT